MTQTYGSDFWFCSSCGGSTKSLSWHQKLNHARYDCKGEGVFAFCPYCGEDVRGQLYDLHRDYECTPISPTALHSESPALLPVAHAGGRLRASMDWLRERLYGWRP